jgi:hypothetical protein
MTDDKRRAQRRRVIKSGKITFGGGAISCVVRNLSESGAMLEVESPVGVPDRFTLVFDSDGVHQECRTVWRKPTRIGVAFENPST